MDIDEPKLKASGVIIAVDATTGNLRLVLVKQLERIVLTRQSEDIGIATVSYANENEFQQLLAVVERLHGRYEWEIDDLPEPSEN